MEFKMKNHIVGLYTAIYHVEDIVRAKEWYSAFLNQAPYFDQPFYVGFNVAGHELGLLPATDTSRKAQGCVCYWGVKDIAKACADFEAKGHQLFEPIKDVGGDIKVAALLDADGNVLGLIENPHFPNVCEK
jgi:predicted enzyme related to lactoylglutathione lyase